MRELKKRIKDLNVYINKLESQTIRDQEDYILKTEQVEI
jgi:hypothetical protein